MAKKERLDYNAELRLLSSDGPGRLYLLYGEEDYLREDFFRRLKQLCLGDGDESFNLRRYEGETFTAAAFAAAVDSMPFLAERTLVEVRGFDINRCREAEAESLKKLFADMPDYCTAVFIQNAGYEPDGRLGLVKALKKAGRAICFTAQDETALIRWIERRFAVLGKSIDGDAAEYLIFAAGTLMNRLIGEIEKLAAGVPGDRISRADIDAMVQRIPEADVFELVDLLGRGRFDPAAAKLGELLAAREEPIKLLALIGMQFRRAFALKVAERGKLDRQATMELCGLRLDFQLRKLRESAGSYTLPQLRNIVRLCAEYDYRMKSGGGEPAALLTEFFGIVAAGVKC